MRHGGHRRTVLAVAGLVVMATAGERAFADNGGLPVAPQTKPASTTATAHLGALTQHRRVLHFRGALGNTSPLPLVNDPDPLVCTGKCREFDFVDNKPNVPVLVSVKSLNTEPNGHFDSDNGYDLYLYGPSGKLVADANGIGSNGQAVRFTPPARGRYTAVVTYIYAYDQNARYSGEVRLLGGKSWHPPKATCNIAVAGKHGCFELPKLRALPAYDLNTTGVPPIASTPLGFPFPMNVPTPTSCYSDETIGLDNTEVDNATNPILRCLRFTTDVQNVGTGELSATLDLLATDSSGKVKSGYVPGDCKARQVVTTASGGTVSRPAGDCEFHTEHAHFHYSGLLRYALFRVGRHGNPRGKVIGSSKASFCLTDDDYMGFGSKRINGPRLYSGQPDCNVPRQVGAPTPGTPQTGTFIAEGMTPGWGDVYTWDTPGQMIDVTHAKAGVYDLVEETNPDGKILVAGPKQTCSMTTLRLTVGKTVDHATPLATKGSIRCPKGM